MPEAHAAETPRWWTVVEHWKLGLAALALLGLWRRSTRRRLEVRPVSEEWLAEHDRTARKDRLL